MKRESSIGEIRGDAVSHGVAVIFSILSLVIFLLKSSSTVEVVASLIFSISMIMLYSMSTLYHSFERTKLKTIFRRLDHAAIYLLIAASIIPFLLIAVNSTKGLIGIILISSAALLGIIFKMINCEKNHRVHIVLYLMLGWSIMFFASDVKEYSSVTFIFLLAGGVVYTLGAAIYALAKFKYSHLIWHIFVVVGSLLHAIAIYSMLGYK